MRRRYPMPLLTDPREFVHTVPIVCWYRADNVARGSGGGVARWMCPVSGLDLTQNSVPNQPPWAIEAGIGAPGVLFDAFNGFITRATGFAWQPFAVEGYYVRLVVKANGLALNRAIVSAGETFGPSWRIESTGSSPDVALVGGPSSVANVNGNLTYGVWRSLEANFSADPSRTFLSVGSVSVSGGSVGLGIPTVTTTTPGRGFAIGSNLSGGTKSGVTVAEVTVTRRTPSTLERAIWAAYENIRYHGGLVA